MDKDSATQPPQNIDVEASLLGGLLIDSDAFIKIGDMLRAEDFYDSRHKAIFAAMNELHNKRSPVDILTLSEQLKGIKQLDAVGGASYLTELTNMVPTASHVEQYAEIIADKAIRRRLIRASHEIADVGADESRSLQELIEEAESRLFEVSQRHVRQDIYSLESILGESFDRLDDLHRHKGGLRGIPTGLRDLDKELAGLQRSDLIVLAARPSMGKTALMLNIALNVATKAKQGAVLIFSLEMGKEQLVDRLLAAEAGVEAWRLRTGEGLTDQDFERISAAMGELAEAPIFIDDYGGITVSDLRTKARRLHHQHPLAVIMVDYLQLMSGGARFTSISNRVQEISEISRSLKILARELNVPIIALSQLSRSVESRSPQIPQLSDLRESGCLTGDSLVVLAETGERAPIKSLVGETGFKILALNDRGLKLKETSVNKVFGTGRKPVYRLTTRLGRTIRATGNHKFRSISGWNRLDSLSVGEQIAIPRALPSNGKGDLSFAEAGLLGHLIGDGCTLPRHAIQYTTRELDLAEEVVELTKIVFGTRIKARINSERQWYQVYLASGIHLTHGVRNPVTVWLDAMGIFGLRSYEKFVPETMFEQPVRTIAVFLKHLWTTDGCIKAPTNGNRHPAIYYASSSRRLASDVQSLLLRLGINAVLRPQSMGLKGRTQYHVRISGHEDILAFVDQVGTVGKYKSDALATCGEYVTGRSSNTSRDIVPSSIWRDAVIPAMKAQGVTSRQFQAAINMSYMGTGLYKQNVSRERMTRLSRAVSSERLTDLAESDVYWDAIRSIEFDGVEEVFDLTVPELSNFVVNDIFAHNSIEQDADIVGFLYREEYYNPETDRQNIMDLLIKKHRNGRTGNIELYFDRDQQRIRDLDTRHEADTEQT